MPITVATPKGHPVNKRRKRLPKQTLDHKHKHEQTSSKICTSKQARHQTTHHHKRQQQSPAPDIIGTDYRYAVEFSKNGRAPLMALRNGWGATFVTLLGPVRSVKPPGPPRFARHLWRPRAAPRSRPLGNTAP